MGFASAKLGNTEGPMSGKLGKAEGVADMSARSILQGSCETVGCETEACLVWELAWKFSDSCRVGVIELDNSFMVT